MSRIAFRRERRVRAKELETLLRSDTAIRIQPLYRPNCFVAIVERYHDAQDINMADIQTNLFINNEVRLNHEGTSLADNIDSMSPPLQERRSPSSTPRTILSSLTKCNALRSKTSTKLLQPLKQHSQDGAGLRLENARKPC